MVFLLIFSVTLLIATLISGIAQRSVISTVILFLIVGVVTGSGVLGWVSVAPTDDIVKTVAQLALVSVLFTDGMRIHAQELAAVWKLPGRALLFGMPFTMAVIGLLGHFLVGLPWLDALLVGAALSPTDPVFASALVGRREVPTLLKRLLNVESGLNDGLALPLVLILLEWLGATHIGFFTILLDIVEGVALGIALPLVILRLSQWIGIAKSDAYEPFMVFSLGLIVYALGALLGVNIYLAAYSAGVVITTIDPKSRRQFEDLGENIMMLLKLAAVMLFGMLISLQVLGQHLVPQVVAFTVLVIVLVRPVALGLALIGSPLNHREYAVATWFGPRGFASMIYGVLILRTPLTEGPFIFHLIALVVTFSILVNSTTDILAVKWLQAGQQQNDQDHKPQPHPPDSNKDQPARDDRQKESARQSYARHDK